MVRLLPKVPTPTSNISTVSPAQRDSRSTVLAQLSMKQFKGIALLIAKYDKWARRQNQNKAVSFLPVQEDFPPNHNPARQKLVPLTIPTSRFDGLLSGKGARGFPESKEDLSLEWSTNVGPGSPVSPTRYYTSSVATHNCFDGSGAGDPDAEEACTSRWMPSVYAAPHSDQTNQIASSSDAQDSESLPVHLKPRGIFGVPSRLSLGEGWPPRRSSIDSFCELTVFRSLAQEVLGANRNICDVSCPGQKDHRCCHGWLSQQLRTWGTWNELETLWNWRTMYGDLCAKYNELKPSNHEMASIGHDLSGLSDLMRKVLDPPSKQQLLESREGNAMALVDLLQILIDYEHWTDHHRPPRARVFERVLKQLAGNSGVLPRYLFLTGVEREGVHPVGGGGFADIYQGKVQGHLVALKVLRFFLTEEEELKVQKGLCKEALIWRQFFHPHILPFYGICRDLFGPRFCLVSPWMKNGNIMNYLSKHPSTKRYPLITKIVSGLCYLHGLEPPVVHGDLRGANILVTDDGDPQIADFGISEVIDSYATGGTATCNTHGTSRWMAPELLDYTQSKEGFIPASTASDVYSFACLCIEVFSGKVPFYNLREPAVAPAILDDKRPERLPEAIAQGLSDSMWDVMQECWRTAKNERPTMATVFERLEGKKYEENVSFEWAWSSRPWEMTETLASICKGMDLRQSPFRC